MAIKKIVVLGEELCIRTEGIAGGVVTPGHLVEGPDSAIVEHSVSAGTALKKFAYENELVGGEIGDDYASADTILLVTCPPGSIVFAIAGTGGVTAEDIVESDGGTIPGALRTQAASAATAEASRASVIGKAMDTAGVGVRFRCEIF